MLLQLNPGLLIWTGLTFLLVLGILGKFAWKPIIGMLEKREQSIQTSIDRTKAAEREAELALMEYQQKLSEISKQAAAELAQARTNAERTRTEIIARANEDAQRMVKQASEQIERQSEQALAKLRLEVADLAVGAAEKILEATIDEAVQRKLVAKYLKTIPANADKA